MKCVGMFVAAGLFWLFVHNESDYNQWRYAYWLQGICLIVYHFMDFMDVEEFMRMQLLWLQKSVISGVMRY
ncbi:unnamed protein product [Cylicostephanus goldi]|uniref:Uncharacterized protein n=1 Tax=Cylicostephanus goldi TaxID=71465 RepID=A0A3P6RJX7_CYLGO|nr:unnamed protein product [Cylicostephanus goldi]